MCNVAFKEKMLFLVGDRVRKPHKSHMQEYVWMALGRSRGMPRRQKRSVALFGLTGIPASRRSNLTSLSFQKNQWENTKPRCEAFCFHYKFTAEELAHAGIRVHSFKGYSENPKKRPNPTVHY